MTIVQGLQLLDMARRLLAGEESDPAAVARSLVGLALDFAPVDYLKDYLTDEARARDEAIADAAELAKVGPP